MSLQTSLKSELEDSILNNPIYLGDGTKNQNVIDRINNAPFMTLFKVMLGRRNMEDGHWKNIYGNVDIDSDEEKNPTNDINFWQFMRRCYDICWQYWGT
jgi:hypothetical protein